ncbi:hypothetical protein ACFWIO_02660 [Streptomyces diastatochromogenes]|uniref:hypothetical protein n=1 Tax=Streptomyces diastatochromogenes TaxID=42236 RepID=UPI00366507CB
MRIQDLTSAAAVEKALAEYDDVGGQAFRGRYGFGPSTQYYLSHGERLYDAKAIAGVAYGYQHPSNGPLSNDQFSGGEAATNRVLRAMGFDVLDSHSETVDAEKEWRLTVWKNLLSRRESSKLVTADVVRSVGAYGNFRGIWADKSRTRRIHPDGVTIGLKHTGQHYPDDLGENGALYHYPVTRQRGRDLGEVNATKAAATLQGCIPLILATVGTSPIESKRGRSRPRSEEGCTRARRGPCATRSVSWQMGRSEVASHSCTLGRSASPTGCNTPRGYSCLWPDSPDTGTLSCPDCLCR